jgi:hypothetical protein
MGMSMHCIYLKSQEIEDLDQKSTVPKAISQLNGQKADIQQSFEAEQNSSHPMAKSKNSFFGLYRYIASEWLSKDMIAS